MIKQMPAEKTFENKNIKMAMKIIKFDSILRFFYKEL